MNGNMNTTPPLLELRAVSKRFGARSGALQAAAQRAGWMSTPPVVHALADVSLQVHAGEAVGLVGESGCGKSTLGRIAVGLLSPDEGARLWQGVAADALSPAARQQARLGAQMIFQDAAAALNPRLRVRELLAEAPRVHGLVRRDEEAAWLAALLAEVGLDAALAERFPHQLSGGQRARAGIARALAVQPQFLVCDEAVAALDVSIQAQILNLLMELRERRRLAYLFISHDLGVVRHLCERVLIMYLGRIVESAPREALFRRPAHPYTVALLATAPQLKVEKRMFAPIHGEPPSPLAPPPGCHFHPRCPHAVERCRIEQPQLRTVGHDHRVACHLDFEHGPTPKIE